MNAEPHITLTWRAQCHIRERFQWTDDRELAGGLFGFADERHVEITEVVANPVQDGTRYGSEVDVPFFLAQQRFATRADDPADDHFFLGGIHSHPDGNARASSQDLDTWETNAAMCWPWYHVGLIVAAGDELWDGGFPSGRPNWTEPTISGWIATRTDLWSAAVVLEDEWMHALKTTVRFRPRRIVHAT